mgnify:CR=1 FL=1
MDINKFKSVAVRKPDYDLYKDYVAKNKMTVETYKQKILINDKPTKQKKVRNGSARR